MPKDTPCIECGFELWIPLKKFSKTTLGLYNDARFPGRSILKLDDHYDQLDEVPETLLKEFWKDINTASKALKNTTRSERINIAILGNRESHVHAHLIPRYSLDEMYPDCSPWDDPRSKTFLTSEEVKRLQKEIIETFNFIK